MAEAVRENSETILVVDDTANVVKLVSTILERARFTVIQAGSGEEASKIVAQYPGTIDLMLSDVTMPGISGPDLGALLKRVRPKMHVMFMSGYSGGDLLVLNYGWAFIQKPFLPTKLVEMVQAVLSTPDRSQGVGQFDTRKDVARGTSARVSGEE